MTADAMSHQERMHKFLKRALPNKKKDDRDKVARALLRAADRYDRYAPHRKEWSSYNTRKGNLASISKGSRIAATCLAELDIISRDDLESRLGRERVMAIIGDLCVLAREVDRLGGYIQKAGKPKDLAEERWIWEVADIYENEFERTASVWGAGSSRGKRRGEFYELLDLSRPDKLPLHGKLHPKQVRTVLKRRSEQSCSKGIVVS